MKVFVYYNLHRHVWSVRAMEGPDKGRVIAHEKEVQLEGVTFKVSEAGRQRVLEQRRKNVHAGVVGEYTPGCCDDLLFYDSDRVTYNPYNAPTFTRRGGKTPVNSADHVAMYAGANGPQVHAWGAAQ